MQLLYETRKFALQTHTKGLKGEFFRLAALDKQEVCSETISVYFLKTKYEVP